MMPRLLPVATAESPPPQLSDTLKKLFHHNKIAIALLKPCDMLSS
ncbi:hypothetical protein [Microcoleus vaginatus]